MDENNPYAPPKATIKDVRDTDCKRDGKVLIVPIGSDLPERCIICNEPAQDPIKKTKLYWHSPWLYLLFLINILVYAIAALIARKTIKVSPGLCVAHTLKRKKRLRLIFILSLISVGIGVCFVKAGEESGAIIAFVMALVILIPAIFVARKLYPKKITKEYAYLGGCKEPFLDSLDSF
jgi:hypothetical protein